MSLLPVLPIAASYSDWNLVLGVFVAVTTLAMAVLGVFLIRRIVQEDRTRRRLDDRLEEQSRDTRRVRERLARAPFGRLSALADTLRRSGIFVGDLTGIHAGRTPGGRRTAYLEAEQGFAPFDAPGRIRAELARGKTLEVRPADPRTVAEAKREYSVGIKVLHTLYLAAFHVARRNETLVEEIDAMHHRIRVLKRSLFAGGVALAALVALPLGLVVAVPTRPLNFHLIDVTITLFAARMLLLTLFIAGTALTVWLLHRALAKIDLTGLRLSLLRDHRSPRAFHERLAVPDQRREARVHALEETDPDPRLEPARASRAPLRPTGGSPGASA